MVSLSRPASVAVSIVLLVSTATPATATPDGLKVTAVSHTSVTLAWNAWAGDVFSYELVLPDRVFRIVPGDRTSKTVDNLVPGTEYRWRIAARDQDMRLSALSDEVVVKTPQYPADSEKPGAPSNPRVAKSSANSISLVWNASTDNVGVASYDVFDGDKKVTTVPGTAAAVNGLRAYSPHEFTVVAKDFAGNRSAASDPVAARTRVGADPVGEARTVATSDDIPWGLTFLPDRSALFSERDTFRIYHVSGGRKTLAATVPDTHSLRGEDGVLGLAVSPDFVRDRWVYVFHTRENDGRIVRVKFVDGTLDFTRAETVLAGIPRAKKHLGGRLRFGPDGKLYVSTGELQRGELAQDLSTLAGKILRINPDGSVPSDNPFPGSAIYSYGHRNPQGLAFDSRGRLWVAEFGHFEVDEINLVKPGGNYGWPYCEGPCGRFVDPVRTFRTFDASPAGIAIVDDVIYLAGARGKRLHRMVIRGDATSEPEPFFRDHYGRLRTVEATPAGNIWLTSTGGDDLHEPGGDANVIVEVRLR
ncbi:PQQ-dependent sugar dehydrogenase [Lentzea tibetensis]|uniref:PQQ-dependent sugar dehydrogenase n=1 Tax=Lentzea tibetensis TaxID=2591470 RepID=UPI0016470D8F|nr:PQQ-dependent sugar dehydrogenase [Lentzea tibetensis]